MRLILVALFALAAGPVASELSLQHPVDCTLGETCFIQSYVDLDPSENARDFRCGPLSYDGHKGTDFALPSTAMMQAGVDVLAAAPGVVRGVRDGMEDRRYTRENAASVANRECGNGMVIAHEGGWETQYCHLRKGSVQVSPGDRVTAGTVLGQVGLSGMTEFPHLHLSVRKDGSVVDPFVPDGADTCTPPERTLWQDSPDYVPGALVSIGFADVVPEYEAVLAGTAKSDTISAQAPALVIFGHAFGVQKGDEMHLVVDGPDGPFATHELVLDRTQARAFRAAGRRRPAEPWPVGTYTGTVILLRNGAEISRMSTTLMVR